MKKVLAIITLAVGVAGIILMLHKIIEVWYELMLELFIRFYM